MQVVQRDYQAISPSLSARAENGNGMNGISGNDGSRQEGTQGEGLEPGNPQRRTESAEREAADVERREGGRLRAFLDKYGSVELENKGSVARDHLALGMFPRFPPPPGWCIHMEYARWTRV